MGTLKSLLELQTADVFILWVSSSNSCTAQFGLHSSNNHFIQLSLDNWLHRSRPLYYHRSASGYSERPLLRLSQGRDDLCRAFFWDILSPSHRLTIPAACGARPQSLVTTVSTTLGYSTISICTKSGHARRNDNCIGTLSYQWFSSLKLPELII